MIHLANHELKLASPRAAPEQQLNPFDLRGGEYLADGGDRR